MHYRVFGLEPAPFRPLYGLSEHALAEHGVQRVKVDAETGYPDRIELRDARRGQYVLLLNYTHQPAATPYRSAHAIFVREGAERVCVIDDALPPALRCRTLSLRAFDVDGVMLDADLAEGEAADPVIERLLQLPRSAYLHAHFARRGCYAARIELA